MDEKVERENLIKFNQEQIETYNLTLSEKYFSIPKEQGAEDIYIAFTSIANPVTITRITDALQSITSEQKEQILWSKIPKELEIAHNERFQYSKLSFSYHYYDSLKELISIHK